MPIDRDAAVRTAEKLLRQGRLDGAIQEYIRLVNDHPGDFGARNTLGDLYLRAGDVERAVVQFVDTADELFTEGFLPKAAALYKKALKLQPNHEHTMWQLSEIAVQQELLADAKAYLRQLAERRRVRGDERGVAECAARLRAIEAGTGDPPAASGPGSAGRVAGAPPWSLAAAGDDPERLMQAARAQIGLGDERQAHVALLRALILDAGRHDEVVELGLEMARSGSVEGGFRCVDVACDAALLAGDWDRAIEALQRLVRAAPHIPALTKLVEICVDADLEAPLRAAQAQLADAYLDTGRGAEARVIAVDLLEHDPECEAHAQRVRRACDLLGTIDGDRAVHDARTRAPQALGSADAGVELLGVDTETLSLAADALPDAVKVDEIVFVTEDEDESVLRDPYDRAMMRLSSGQIESAMADLEEAYREPHTSAKAAAALGRVHRDLGNLPAAVEWLERAADGPSDSPQATFEILYELADALERLGEPARALAILMELDADAGGYRDVRARIEQLAHGQGGGEG